MSDSLLDILIVAMWLLAGVWLGQGFIYLNRRGRDIGEWLRMAWRYRKASRDYRAGRRSWR